MNWTHFLLGLAGAYSLYYLVVILTDLAGLRRKHSANSTTDELTFFEQVTPVQLSSLPENKKAEDQKPVNARNEPEVIASGGVPITDLFRLAKQEAIIYTRSVSF
jgi:hypothetical protein